jgi:hypothetical protein
MPTQISPMHWDLIVKRISQGDCVPFLGAAVNLSRPPYEGLPLGTEVSARLVRKLIGLDENSGEDLARVRPHKNFKKWRRHEELAKTAIYNLPRVALHMEGTKTDRTFFLELLCEMLPDDKREPSALLQLLAALPLDLIVTTNYDRLLEKAFRVKGRDFELVVQRPKGFTTADEQRAVRDKLLNATVPIVYKLHGSFGKDPTYDATEIIISEEDYIQFLAIIGVDDVGVPRLIKDRITTSTLLFLGYSLEDWDFRTLYKGLIENLSMHQQRQSFALQKDPPQFWVDYWQAKKVTIYNVDLYEFADELREQYKNRTGTAL